MPSVCVFPFQGSLRRLEKEPLHPLCLNLSATKESNCSSTMLTPEKVAQLDSHSNSHKQTMKSGHLKELQLGFIVPDRVSSDGKPPAKTPPPSTPPSKKSGLESDTGGITAISYLYVECEAIIFSSPSMNIKEKPHTPLTKGRALACQSGFSRRRNSLFLSAISLQPNPHHDETHYLQLNSITSINRLHRWNHTLTLTYTHTEWGESMPWLPCQ